MPVPATVSKQRAPGFTLIEVLVVLVLVGLVAGVALPRLLVISQRFETAANKKQLLAEIAGLGYRAYVTGRPLTLVSLPSADPQTDPVALPPGWGIEVATPLKYAFTGVCGGGRITITGPGEGPETWDLPPPFCKPVPAK